MMRLGLPLGFEFRFPLPKSSKTRSKTRERKLKKVRREPITLVEVIEDTRIPTIYFSALFLYEAWKYLMSYGEDEVLCHVTGLVDETTNTIYPFKILKTKMSYQDPAWVRADSYGTYSTMDLLDRFHHPVMCLFHRHPGNFIPSPSGQDKKNHAEHEQLYGDIIGGIFVKSGYIKFFSVNKKFKIKIYGKGVIKLGRHTYKLDIEN